MRIRSRYTTFLLVTLLVNTAAAAGPSQPVDWDRGSAMAAVRSVDIDLAVNNIHDLEDIQALEQRDDWPLPAREAALYKFTQTLATLPRDAVAVDVMQHLGRYQAQVLVALEDHGEAMVPLFNIRGAAAGVENTWIRAESAAAAETLLAIEPALLPAEYLKLTSSSQKSGYLEALRRTDPASARAVQAAALEQLDAAPGLTRLLAETARITADAYATQRLLMDGTGAGLAPALKDLGAHTNTTDTAALLKLAIEQAPAANAALAIAAWWPALRNDADSRQLMLENLPDPELGAPIALALAQNPDMQTIRELQLIAGGDSLAARRAQLALEVNRNDLLNNDPLKGVQQ